MLLGCCLACMLLIKLYTFKDEQWFNIDGESSGDKIQMYQILNNIGAKI